MSGQRSGLVFRDGGDRADRSAAVVTLWVVAAFLAGLVASHYVLGTLLGPETGDLASAISSGGSVL